MRLYKRQLFVVCNLPAWFIGRSCYGIKIFLIYQLISGHNVQGVVWLIGLKFPTMCHHLAKLSGHGACGSSVTAAKTFYVTLQDLAIKGVGNYMEGKSSLFIPTLPKLVAIDIVLMVFTHKIVL